LRAAASLLVLLTILPALAGCFGGQGNTIDPAAVKLVVNAKIWTADEERPFAEALAFRNDTILFVGTEADARRAYPEAQLIDAGGRRMTPGLIDSHTHFVRVGAAWDCDETNNPFRPTFDNSQLAGMEYEVSRAQIALGHYQTNQSGQTPVDDTSTIADKAAAERGLACAMQQANAMGLTMTVEAGTSSWDYLTVLQNLETKNLSTLRESLYLTPPQLDQARQRGIANGWGTDYVRVAGIKFYSDGWLGPRTSAVIEPYTDRPFSRGVLFLEEQEAHEWVRRAVDAGLKPATHAIGDKGVLTMLEAYEASSPEETWASRRFTFEHAQVMKPTLVNGMAELGAIVSFQLSFATTDQRFAEAALGPERTATSYVWKDMLEEGVILAGGSDFPIEVLAPLWGLQRVVTRQELDGTPPGGWHPEQRLTIEEALRSMTISAAYNVWMEDTVGSLEAGKLADFVLFDKDILTIDPHEIARTCVHQTWVGGRLVYDSDAGVPCSDVAFTGTLPKKDPSVLAAIEEQLENEAFQGTRLA
jgi:predicted amidohydrolase YtcJ